MKICVDCGCTYTRTSNVQKRCKECKVALNLKRATNWYLDNKNKKKDYDTKRREDKRHLYREASKRHRENNPAKIKEGVITRRQGIKQRTPMWANMKYMNLFYKIAKLEQIRTGKPVHVDHIYPLKSDWVCGLHNEFNMQLLFAEENIRKGNKKNHYSFEHEGMK